MLKRALLLSLLLVLFSFVLPARAGTLDVTDCTASAGAPGRLAEVIASAISGDTIQFTCSGTIPFLDEIIPNKSLTINGGGMITFNGGGVTRFFTVNSGAIFAFDGITFTNGYEAGSAGAILTSSMLTITNSTFSGNWASFGGAIYNGGTVTISNSTFSGNSGGYGGVIYNNGGTITINNSTISGNSALVTAGVLDQNGGTTTINNSTISGNSGVTAGAIINNSGTVNSQNTHYVGDATNNTCGGIITDLGGNTRVNSAGCPGTAPIVPVPVVTPAPVVLSPDLTALGCVLTADVDIAGVPDNTYCRILMRDGVVVNYSGAVPADLIALGVKIAVDVYRLDGGTSIADFGGYSRVCLFGMGRLFYLDARQSPRPSVELATELLSGATCGWIPSAGTLVLTN